MKANKLRSVLKNLTEQKAPSAQIDLWPAIQSRIPVSQSTQSRGTIMEPYAQKQPVPQHRSLKPVFVLAAIVLVGGLFLLIPQGRALAQEVMHFFTRGESNFMPGVTVTPEKWVEQTPGIAAATLTPQPTSTVPASLGPAFEADCGFYNEPRCSIEAIRRMAAFPVYALPTLPDGMYFVGATGRQDQVHLFYTNPGHTGNILIWEEPISADGTLQAIYVGADAEVQQVQVGAATGEYVKGVYDGSSNPPAWNSNADVQVLRWVNQGILFNLQLLGAEPRLSRDDLVTLAETLTDDPVGVNGEPALVTIVTPTPESTFDPRTLYPRTLAQSEERAGFTPLSPSRLPESYSFIGTAYDEQTKVLEISYIYHHPDYAEAQGSLLVREQLAPEGVDCDLCGFIYRDRKLPLDAPLNTILKMVPQDATIETVQIGDGFGQYVQGVEYNGGQWDPIPFRKRLRFKINGLAIELWSDSNEMTKAELIAIAESLR